MRPEQPSRAAAAARRASRWLALAAGLAAAAAAWAAGSEQAAAPAPGWPAPADSGSGQPPGPPVGAAGMAAAAGLGGAADHPRRRAGLWEIDTIGAQAAGLPSAQYCVEDSTDRPMQHLDRTFGTKGACRFGAFRRAGSAWVSETVCREPRTVVTTRSVASGDFGSSYRIDTLITYDPPLGGVRREERTATVGRWLGACRPGQHAGDLSMPGMGRLNMQDGSVSAETDARKPATPRRRASKQADG